MSGDWRVNNPYAYGRIPSRPFTEIVNGFLDRVEMGEQFQPSFGFKGSERAVPQTYSAIEAVASWAGVKRDTLEKALKGRGATITFDFADKVLCATVGPDAWHSDPELNEQYNRVSLAGPA